MNCPICDFQFKAFAVNSSEIPEFAPIVCEGCGEVSLIEDGKIRTLSPHELDSVKNSPAWEFIGPVQKLIRRHNSETAN